MPAAESATRGASASPKGVNVASGRHLGNQDLLGAGAVNLRLSPQLLLRPPPCSVRFGFDLGRDSPSHVAQGPHDSMPQTLPVLVPIAWPSEVQTSHSGR